MTTSLPRGTDRSPDRPAPLADQGGGGASRTDGLVRPLAAVALILAPVALLVANTSYAWATRDGGSDTTGADALALAGQHPGLYRLGHVAAMIGCLLLVPAVLGAIRLAGRRAPWLTLTGGSLMIAGYVCYLGVLAASFQTVAMAQTGAPAGVFARIIDTSQGDAAFVWLFVLFVLGNLAGTFLLGLGLLRSTVVPAWAAAAVLAWPVLHISGLAAGTEWFEVAGAALQAAGLAVAAVAVLRRRGGWAPAAAGYRQQHPPAR